MPKDNFNLLTIRGSLIAHQPVWFVPVTFPSWVKHATSCTTAGLTGHDILGAFQNVFGIPENFTLKKYFKSRKDEPSVITMCRKSFEPNAFMRVHDIKISLAKSPKI